MKSLYGEEKGKQNCDLGIHLLKVITIEVFENLQNSDRKSLTFDDFTEDLRPDSVVKFEEVEPTYVEDGINL